MKKNRKRPSRLVNFLFLLAAAACLLYYLANGQIVRFGQSLLWLWPVFACLLLWRFVMVARMIRTGKPSPIPRWLLKTGHTLLALALIFFLAIEGVILQGAFMSAPENLDYIIVLGAKVNGTSPSGALRNRIQVASEYMTENPDTVCVASGGQGDDEGISEAECILRGLTSRGIDASRVILEDRSTSTVENLRFSLEKIESPESASVGIVTNNFHIYRAMKTARAQNCGTFFGIPVSTSLLSYPHYILREFAAVVVGTLTGSW